jgi:hypothetical protein
MVMQYYQRIAITFVDVLFIQQEFVPREIVEVEREGPREHISDRHPYLSPGAQEQQGRPRLFHLRVLFLAVLGSR